MLDKIKEYFSSEDGKKLLPYLLAGGGGAAASTALSLGRKRKPDGEEEETSDYVKRILANAGIGAGLGVGGLAVTRQGLGALSGAGSSLSKAIGGDAGPTDSETLLEWAKRRATSIGDTFTKAVGDDENVNYDVAAGGAIGGALGASTGAAFGRKSLSKAHNAVADGANAAKKSLLGSLTSYVDEVQPSAGVGRDVLEKSVVNALKHAKPGRPLLPEQQKIISNFASVLEPDTKVTFHQDMRAAGLDWDPSRLGKPHTGAMQSGAVDAAHRLTKKPFGARVAAGAKTVGGGSLGGLLGALLGGVIDASSSARPDGSTVTD